MFGVELVAKQSRISSVRTIVSMRSCRDARKSDWRPAGRWHLIGC